MCCQPSQEQAWYLPLLDTIFIYGSDFLTYANDGAVTILLWLSNEVPKSGEKLLFLALMCYPKNEAHMLGVFEGM